MVERMNLDGKKDENIASGTDYNRINRGGNSI